MLNRAFVVEAFGGIPRNSHPAPEMDHSPAWCTKKSGPKPAPFDCNQTVQAIGPQRKALHVHTTHATTRRAMCVLFFFRCLGNHDFRREQQARNRGGIL